MSRVVYWLQSNEQRIFLWVNRGPSHRGLNKWLGRWLNMITHTGGATFTLVTALLCALLASEPWHTAGWQAAIAVAISHLPVALVKRKFRRLRPHQALPKVNTVLKPLCDSSFPSGHTTAIFAWLMPWLAAESALMPLLLPVALILGVSVGWSRMYLGLHYPSDVAAGAVLGSLTSMLVCAAWSFN